MSSVLLFAYSIEEALRISSDLGYDGIELWHFHLLKTGEDHKQIGRLARQFNQELSVHALSWDLNFTSALPEIRRASLDMLSSSVRLAREVGSARVIIHPGRITVPHDSPDRYWEYLVDGVTCLADAAQKYQIEISTEIMEPIPGEFFIAPEDAATLLDRVNRSNLSITFDGAHVPWLQDPLEALRKTPGVKHIHISDVNETKFHLPLGQGKRDFAPLLSYAVDHIPGLIVALEGIEYQRTTVLAVENKAYFDRISA
jgi:sugar phosphate isomerase/epimerase